MFGLFRRKKKIEILEEEVRDAFDKVKEDFAKVSKWIRHFDDKHQKYEDELKSLKDELLMLHKDLVEIKDYISFFKPTNSMGLFKQPQTAVVKQTPADDVQTAVQTTVQTDILSKLTVMERAIIWALLNSEMKLSYEDLASLLGKGKSTIRGQINAIKQKSESLIKETREINGKKRLYIPEEIKEKILKSVKVSVNKLKKDKIKKEMIGE